MRSRPARPVSSPGAHVGLGLTALAAVGGFVAPRADGFDPTVPGVMFAVLGWLILRQRPRHGIGRLYLAIGFLVASFAFLNGRDTGLQATVAEQPVLWFISWAWAVGLIAPVTLGVLLVPDGRLPSPRWRWVVWVLAAGCACLILALPYDTGAPAGLRLTAPPQFVVDVLFGLGVLLSLVAVLASTASPFVRYRRAGARDRSALRLVGLGAMLSVGIYVGGTAVPSLSGDLVAGVSIAVLPVAVTVAIVRHGLGELDRLVSRVVSYLIVSVVLAAVYVSLVLVPTVAIGGEAVPDAAVALATLVAAALFRPVRSRVQAAVDRRFDRNRFDAGLELAAFAGRLRHELDQAAITSDLRTVVGATVSPTHARVWLASGGSP